MKKISILSFLAILCLQTLIWADRSAFIKDPFGSEKKIPVATVNGKEYVSLYALAEVGNLMYDFDRITRKAIIQNDDLLVQVMPDNNTFSCNIDLGYTTDRPVIFQGGIFFPVSALPFLMEKIGLRSHSLSFRDDPRDNNIFLAKVSAQKDAVPEIEPSFAPQTPAIVPILGEEATIVPKFEHQRNEKTAAGYLSSEHTLKFIILDPGHGGTDPGGVGVTGLREKIVVMKVSDMVKQSLEKKLPDIKVVMTRDGNQYVGLNERSILANENLKRSKHGIFLSIHANISRDSVASGYETYFLSENPSDDEARAVSALENGYFAAEKSDMSPVNKMLAGMLDAELIRQAKMLAECITSGYQRYLPAGTPNRGIKSARFRVLEGSMMPSILTEIGFLSNNWEEKKMKDDAYLQTIANAIADGIVNFVINYNKYKGFS